MPLRSMHSERRWKRHRNTSPDPSNLLPVVHRSHIGATQFGLADHAWLMSSSEWSTMKSTANAYNQDHVFVAFWGFEWSSNGDWGHVTVVNTDVGCASVT